MIRVINKEEIKIINKLCIGTHNGRFFAKAYEYTDILKMCKIAIEKHFQDNKKL